MATPAEAPLGESNEISSSSSASTAVAPPSRPLTFRLLVAVFMWVAAAGVSAACISILVTHGRRNVDAQVVALSTQRVHKSKAELERAIDRSHYAVQGLVNATLRFETPSWPYPDAMTVPSTARQNITRRLFMDLVMRFGSEVGSLNAVQSR
jgi:hypothetical protein